MSEEGTSNPTMRELELIRYVESLTAQRDKLLADMHDLESRHMSGADKLESPEYLIRSFQTDLSLGDKAARIVFYKQPSQRHVLAYFVMDAPELYEFAQGILRDYDKLEGVA